MATVLDTETFDKAMERIEINGKVIGNAANRRIGQSWLDIVGAYKPAKKFSRIDDFVEPPSPKTPEAPVVKEPVVEEPVGVAVAVSEDKALLDEYQALAAEVGFRPGFLNVERFKHFLSENGILCYERAKVKAYLDSKWGTATATPTGFMIPWAWVPLRESDKFPFSPHMATDMVMGARPTYNKAIPMPVLRTAQRVLKEFPDVRFYVSDYIDIQVDNKDPFLMAVFDRLAFIIERWDEPSFRG